MSIQYSGMVTYPDYQVGEAISFKAVLLLLLCCAALWEISSKRPTHGSTRQTTDDRRSGSVQVTGPVQLKVSLPLGSGPGALPTLVHASPSPLGSSATLPYPPRTMEVPRTFVCVEMVSFCSRNRIAPYLGTGEEEDRRLGKGTG